VLLHGTGPFTKGRIGMIPLAQELARNGYVAIAVSYRYRPEEKFPAPIQDVNCAIRWVQDHSVQYKVDKDRIGVVGFSGGGALACLLGMKGGQDLPNEGKDATQSVPLRAIVSFYAPTDFARFHEDCQKKVKEGSKAEKLLGDLMMKALEKWFGGPPSKFPKLYDEVSPIKQVTKDSPPILLIHGAEDKVVPVDQSRLLAKKLKELRRPFSFLVIEGSGHDFEEIDKTNGRMTIAAVLAFLEEHLLKNSEAKALVKKADPSSP
jgi:acetyl esterase/lipase